MNGTVLVTGASGLIGSEAVRFFSRKGFDVVGIDNDSRRRFFGDAASTLWNRDLLGAELKDYTHLDFDIREESRVNRLFQEHPVSLVIHAAGQPSHEWSATEPLADFSINAVGTHIVLEATRRFAPDAVFIFTSTNKVYGDRPNRLPLTELETRWELPLDHPYYRGIDEQIGVDDCTHSVFGVSKLAADLMVQEYGRYFQMKTVTFRCGCLTGPSQSPTQLHGFLAYLVRTVAMGETYTAFGYKGKQVRDNIHSEDVVNAFYEYYLSPRPGEIYNLGGSRRSNVSILEAIAQVEALAGNKAKLEISSTNRLADHRWYISDVSRFRSHYPRWEVTRDGAQLIEELFNVMSQRAQR